MNCKRIIFILFCAIGTLVALIWPVLPVVSGEDRLSKLPSSGADFDSVSVPLTSDDIEFLNGARACIRHIQLHTGGRLILTVIDGTENRHAVHDPSYCLAGGGWKIKDKKRIPMPSGEAALIAMTKDHATAEAMWFFDDKKSQFTSPIAYWARTSARRMTLGRSGSEPLLVTLRALPGEQIDWDEIRLKILPAIGF